MSSRSEKDKQQKIQDRCQAELSQLLRDEDNKYCVDCDAKGPRWASWNIGIFLCIRCAGIHRNLGVHISKVKSVNLDTWTPEQVVSLQQMGNSRARAVYEANIPDSFRRPQTDSSLEAFIRSKYEQKKYIAKEWVPPPMPKVNWDLELEDRKKDKKRSKGVTAKVELPAPIALSKPPPSKSGGSPSVDKKAATKKSAEPSTSTPKPSATEDLLGLDTTSASPASQAVPSSDPFELMMGGPPLPSTGEIASSSSPLPATSTQESSSTNPDSEEKNFFNQTAPVSEDKRQALSTDSIMALFSKGSSTGGMQQMNLISSSQQQQPPPPPQQQQSQLLFGNLQQQQQTNLMNAGLQNNLMGSTQTHQSNFMNASSQFSNLMAGPTQQQGLASTAQFMKSPGTITSSNLMGTTQQANLLGQQVNLMTSTPQQVSFGQQQQANLIGSLQQSNLMNVSHSNSIVSSPSQPSGLMDSPNQASLQQSNLMASPQQNLMGMQGGLISSSSPMFTQAFQQSPQLNSSPGMALPQQQQMSMPMQQQPQPGYNITDNPEHMWDFGYHDVAQLYASDSSNGMQLQSHLASMSLGQPNQPAAPMANTQQRPMGGMQFNQTGGLPQPQPGQTLATNLWQ